MGKLRHHLRVLEDVRFEQLIVGLLSLPIVLRALRMKFQGILVELEGLLELDLSRVINLLLEVVFGFDIKSRKPGHRGPRGCLSQRQPTCDHSSHSGISSSNLGGSCSYAAGVVFLATEM